MDAVEPARLELKSSQTAPNGRMLALLTLPVPTVLLATPRGVRRSVWSVPALWTPEPHQGSSAL